MEIISTNALISINATFIAQMLSFLIFVFLCNRVMLRPLYGVIQKRKEYIGRIQTEISAAKKTLNDFAADLEEKKQSVREEAFKLNEEKEEMAAKEAAKMISAARKEIAELGLAAEKDVARQIKDAQTYFEKETRAISLVMMEQVLGRKIG